MNSSMLSLPALYRFYEALSPVLLPSSSRYSARWIRTTVKQEADYPREIATIASSMLDVQHHSVHACRCPTLGDHRSLSDFQHGHELWLWLL